MTTLPETARPTPVIRWPSTDSSPWCGEAPPSERLQGLADGVAVIAGGMSLHGEQGPVIAYLDSVVVSLTDLAGELAGIELWA